MFACMTTEKFNIQNFSYKFCHGSHALITKSILACRSIGLHTVMATITAIIAMPFFAVFIAVVHGDGTCKVAPCNCSFSNIDALSNYIDERINATVDERIATAIDSDSAMWTPVAKTVVGPADGVSLERATTYDFQIPDVIPLTAREFMLYATVECGYARNYNTVDIIFYVYANGLRFEKFLHMAGYDQLAFNTNSDNMWFPMPAHRLVHLEITVGITGNCDVLQYITGYR